MRERQFELPIGQQYARQLSVVDPQKLATQASIAGHDAIFQAARAVSEADLVPAYLHSALCAMSLPSRRPADEMAPIIRKDGRYTLAITPKPILQRRDGEMVMQSLGVPFGSYPRIILIYIMSEAVRSNSRDIYLGTSFAAWLRRLGYENASRGSRGTATLLRGQLERLLACEWMIRWDDNASDDAAFAVKEVKLANEYSGLRTSEGSFIKELRLAEGFFTHLREHAVPLNEAAIRELKNNPTALDLYTYLAYRLQRISGDRPEILSWAQLATHLGNAAESPRKFRQTIRQSWDLVSGVYPNANVDLSGPLIRMWSSPAPIEKKIFAPRLTLVQNKPPAGPSSSTPAIPKVEPASFPSGSLSYGDGDEGFFRRIAKAEGGGYDIDNIADAYRAQVGAEIKSLTGVRLANSFKAFCVSFARRRGPLI